MLWAPGSAAAADDPSLLLLLLLQRPRPGRWTPCGATPTTCPVSCSTHARYAAAPVQAPVVQDNSQAQHEHNVALVMYAGDDASRQRSSSG